MNPKIVISAIVAIAIIVVVLAPFFKDHGCEIKPPQTLSGEEITISNSIAAELQKISTSAEIESDFKQTLNVHFGKLSDEQASLLIFLRAIHCYLKMGKIGEEMAESLMEIVITRWGSARGIASISPRLTPIKEAMIKESVYGVEILRLISTISESDAG